mgnify:CR=1 FL=1
MSESEKQPMKFVPVAPQDLSGKTMGELVALLTNAMDEQSAWMMEVQRIADEIALREPPA